MSANAALLESQIRHQVYLLRRGAGMANELDPIVQQAIDKTVALLGSTPDRAVSQIVMLTELRDLLADHYAELTAEASQMALDLAEYEAGYQARLLGQVSTANIVMPSLEVIAATALSDPLELVPGRSMSVNEALRDFSDAKTRQIIQTITDGVTTGATRAQMTEQVRDLSNLHRHQADTLVRTITSGVAGSAKNMTYRANNDVISKFRYTATCDHRTRREHIALDGRTWSTLEESLQPPQGWNCRCVLVPILEDRFQKDGLEGGRPVDGDHGPMELGAQVTYTGFLRRQSVEFQDEVLGRETAKLWRAGKITLNDLANPFGEPVSLAQLRALDGA